VKYRELEATIRVMIQKQVLKQALNVSLILSRWLLSSEAAINQAQYKWRSNQRANSHRAVWLDLQSDEGFAGDSAF
jgi:hypothetical protein